MTAAADHAQPYNIDVVCLATQGSLSGDERRIAYLLEPLHPRVYPVDRARRAQLPIELIRETRRQRPDVVVLEGTGAAGGIAVMAARLLRGVPYIVSSGDAVAAFLRAFHPAASLLSPFYERSLYRLSAGFIGWSPYLVGRALELGAPRGMTAAHYSFTRPMPAAREAVRSELGIPPDAIVIGVAGHLLVDPRQGYSYGVDLIRAVRRTDRSDLRILIVGGGEGLRPLVTLAGSELGRRVLLPGGCPPARVGDYLAAMDVGVLSQSTDRVGALRYTTKLPEYLAAGLPVITAETPLAYDLDGGWLWRLPGDAPWHEDHIEALADFMRNISRNEIAEKAGLVPHDLDTFDAEGQQQRVCAFVREAITRAKRLSR